MNAHLTPTLLLASALLFVAPVAHSSETSSLPRGFHLPDRVASFQRGTVTNNESRSPGLGVTVAYSSPEIKATVFIYDLGNTNLSDDSTGSFTQREAERSLREVQELNRPIIVLEDLSSASGPCAGFVRATLKYNERGNAATEPLRSHLYLGIRRGKFVKLRISYPDRLSFKTGVVTSARFADELCREINS